MRSAPLKTRWHSSVAPENHDQRNCVTKCDDQARANAVNEQTEFPHYMLREIFEQPEAIEKTVVGRISVPDSVVNLSQEVNIPAEELRQLNRINIVASGTSRHAGIVGQYMLQELSGIPVEVDYASEFEYSNPAVGTHELTIVITQ